jgi:hypothetical protein
VTQDIVVTLIALLTVSLLVARWWRRRQRQESHCASCETQVTNKPEPKPRTDASGAEIKPVAFFGSSGRSRRQ